MLKIALVTVGFLSLFTFGAVSSIAGSTRCTVTEVSGTTVTIDCGKKADKFTVGDKVKVKAPKTAAIEGC